MARRIPFKRQCAVSLFYALSGLYRDSVTPRQFPPPLGGYPNFGNAQPPPMWEGAGGGSLQIACAKRIPCLTQCGDALSFSTCASDHTICAAISKYHSRSEFLIEKCGMSPIFPKHIKGFLLTPSPRGEGRGGSLKTA